MSAYSTGLRLADKAAIALVIPPANYTGAASTDVYVSTRSAAAVNFVVTTGAWAGGTAAVTLLQAKDVSGTSSKALSFTVVQSNSADTTKSVMAETAVSGDTFNLSAANQVFVITVRSAALDVSNGFDCVAVHVASPGSNADYYSATAVMEPAGYSGATLQDVLSN